MTGIALTSDHVHIELAVGRATHLVQPAAEHALGKIVCRLERLADLGVWYGATCQVLVHQLLRSGAEQTSAFGQYGV